MDEPTNFVEPSTINKLTLLEQVKLQAQVVVLLLRAFRKELGRERANAIHTVRSTSGHAGSSTS